MNWYAALVVIVILGAASVGFARYNYAKGGPPPTVDQTWHAGLAFDICGKTEPALAASPTSSTAGLTTTGSGVLLIAPKTSSEAGNNATLGKFASEYSGLTLTNSSVKYPGAKEYTNGQKCAAGTPDAGKAGILRARTWTLSVPTSTASGSETKELGGGYTTTPADLKFVNKQLITVGFVPAGTRLPRIPTATELALVQAINGTTAPVTTTTTTAPATTTPTTAPVATTTTTTTAPVTTTTTKTAPVATTTTKPSS